MESILVLNSSVYGESSVSRQLVGEFVRRIRATNAHAQIVERDLGGSPIPHLTTGNIAGVRGTPATPEEHEARRLSDQLLSELRAADTLVIGSPMYNFSISTVLRSWFDYVLRPGETFQYSEAGPKGLLAHKRVVVVEARGGLYSEGPGQAMDFQEPYLRQLLGFMGLTDVTFVHAEKLGFGPEAREAAIAKATQRLGQLSMAPAAVTS